MNPILDPHGACGALEMEENIAMNFDTPPVDFELSKLDELATLTTTPQFDLTNNSSLPSEILERTIRKSFRLVDEYELAQPGPISDKPNYPLAIEVCTHTPGQRRAYRYGASHLTLTITRKEQENPELLNLLGLMLPEVVKFYRDYRRSLLDCHAEDMSTDLMLTAVDE